MCKAGNLVIQMGFYGNTGANKMQWMFIEVEGMRSDQMGVT